MNRVHYIYIIVLLGLFACKNPRPEPPSTVTKVKEEKQEELIVKEKKVEPLENEKFNVSKIVFAKQDAGGFLSNINFITSWNVLGGFPYHAALDKKSINKVLSVLHQDFIKNEKEVSDKIKHPKCSWKFVRFTSQDNPGRIDLRNFLGNKYKYAVAYAVAYLDCEQDQEDLRLFVGGCSYIKVWINHQLVYAYDLNKRPSKWDQDQIKGIKLKKGENIISVKSVAIDKEWNFYLRLADKNNNVLKFVPAENKKL